MAEIEVDADEFVAVDPGEVAFGDGGFDVGLDFGEAGEVGLARGEGLFVEVGGDARQAEAFGAELAPAADEGAPGDAGVLSAEWGVGSAEFRSARVRWETWVAEAMQAGPRPA